MAAQWIDVSLVVDTDVDDDRHGLADLLAALGGIPDWTRRARCNGLNVNVWHPTTKTHTTKMATNICSLCDTRAECAAYALEHDGSGRPAGIYGGMTPNPRKALRETAA